ncbi:MAG: AraC family transcriptional regulator [Aliidongia sp.]
MHGRAINDASNLRAIALKRQHLWFTDSAPHPRPLATEIQSLGRGSFTTFHLDADQCSTDTQYPPSIRTVCLVLRGTVEWRVDGRLLRVGPGDLLVTATQQALGRSGTRASAGELYWLRLRLNPAAGEAAAAIGDALDRHALRIIRAPRAAALMFDRLLAEHRSADEHGAWAAGAALHCLLAEIIRAYDAAPRGSGQAEPGQAVAVAMAIIEDRLAEPLTVGELAAAVRLSPGQFHDRFLRETGYTPADYRSRRRLARALELLADGGLSVTDVALTLGFSTSQYFATFFRRFTGMSPRDHRRHLRVQ